MEYDRISRCISQSKVTWHRTAANSLFFLQIEVAALECDHFQCETEKPWTTQNISHDCLFVGEYQNNSDGALRMPMPGLSCPTAGNASLIVDSQQLCSVLTSAHTLLSSLPKEGGTFVPDCLGHLLLRTTTAKPPRSLNSVLEAALPA
jgi:hypothetical protein